MIWFVQSSLDDPLDLGQFSCTVVNVSFAVVNAQGASDYSPPATICVHGGWCSESKIIWGGGWLGDFVLPPPSPFNSHPGLKIVGQRGHFSLTYFYFIFLETVFPSQPNLEEVEYEFIEDVREGFFGKAIVKVFWNASQGS